MGSTPIIKFTLLAPSCVAYILRGFPGSLVARIRLLFFWLWHGTRSPTGTDHLVGTENGTIAALAGLIERIRPDLIHADNCEAICAVAQAAPHDGLKLVGFVRDNRFLCSRADQDPRTAAGVCTTCSTNCVVGQSLTGRHTKSMLRQSSRYRLAQLSAMTRLVVSSAYLRRQVETVLPGRVVTVVPNPVDTWRHRHLRSREGAIISGDPGAFAIAVVGTLTAKKGQAALLSHLPDIMRAIRQPHVHLAGEGEDRGLIEKLILRHHADHMVTLHGRLDREPLYDLLASCRIVAVPAVWPEPFGRVPIEAASLGLPTVAFRTGGLGELIDDGRTGILVEPGDYRQFIAALSRLAADSVLSETMGRAAQAAVVRRHDPHLAAEGLAAVWTSVQDADDYECCGKIS